MTYAQSSDAQQAYELTRGLQNYFAKKLGELSSQYGNDSAFVEKKWLRDAGKHGGGSRFEASDEQLFNRGSINVSQVHYDDMPTKKLSSATAISTIIHPQNPHAPSIHMHISFTQMREGKSYWRIMADLNPSISNQTDKESFTQSIKNLVNEYADEGIQQGDKYFYIPTLKRSRGVSHFYLENFTSGKFEQDYLFTQKFGKGIIDTYTTILDNAFRSRKAISEADKKQQLAYHTLYLFQVLTLDRGTTSGLLIHDQNDTGIMGSLPNHVNKRVLKSWKSAMPQPQDELLESLIDVIPDDGAITLEVKKSLAKAVREHYKKYPQALSMQASGNIIPSTVANHIKA